MPVAEAVATLRETLGGSGGALGAAVGASVGAPATVTPVTPTSASDVMPASAAALAIAELKAPEETAMPRDDESEVTNPAPSSSTDVAGTLMPNEMLAAAVASSFRC